MCTPNGPGIPRTGRWSSHAPVRWSWGCRRSPSPSTPTSPAGSSAPKPQGGCGWPSAWIGPDGRFSPPPLDAAGYLASVQRCRDRFPGLRILSGTELGEPHWHKDEVRALLGAGTFDRVLGSVHSLELDATRLVDLLFDQADPAVLLLAHLDEPLRLAESPAPFAVPSP